MNQVSNAAEAIKGSGNITVSTLNRYVDNPLKRYDHIKKDEYAVLAVSDDDLKISSDDHERIFEPSKQKAIIVSGFAETEDVREIQKISAGKFLRKPLMSNLHIV